MINGRSFDNFCLFTHCIASLARFAYTKHKIMNRRTIIIWTGVNSLFLILSFILPDIIHRQLILTPNSVAYKMWKNLPVPIYLDLFVYDWVNAREFEENPAEVKPLFKEVGPFVYEEIRGRVNVSWSDDGSTVFYNVTRTWKYLSEESSDVSVKVTNLNCLALTIAYMSRLWNSALYNKIINTLINKYESLFVTAPVENWLFKGITHNLLEHLNAMRNITEIPIPYEKFGWFYDRNESSSFDGNFEMDTGVKDMYNLGTLLTWNYMNKTNNYEDECAKVKGYAGELIAPIRKSQDSITLFSPDMCSYMTLKQQGNVEVEGLKCNLYESDESVLDNGELHPENRCFHVGEPTPGGARNVSACKFGSPAFVSFPHFYSADPIYTQKIDGLAPNRENHSFRLSLDPKTGVAFEVHGGIQINVLLRPYNCCDMFKNVPELYVPMLWLRQRAKISPWLAFSVKILHFSIDYGSIVFLVLAESGFIIMCAYLLVPRFCKKSHDSIDITTHKGVKERFKRNEKFISKPE